MGIVKLRQRLTEQADDRPCRQLPRLPIPTRDHQSKDSTPRRLITDNRSYSAAHGIVMTSVVHSTQQYEDNRAEVSHQPTRQRERQMRRFKSVAHAQLFLSVQGPVRSLLRVGRHLLRAVHQRVLRTGSFLVWWTDHPRQLDNAIPEPDLERQP